MITKITDNLQNVIDGIERGDSSVLRNANQVVFYLKECLSLRSQKARLIDDAETLSAFVNTALPLRQHRELMEELKGDQSERRTS